MSTIESELTKLINPELTWKTVVKGNRSARKPVARTFFMGMELSEKCRGKVDDKVSDTEKNGVAILGRRFGDRVEHVPLKKRRSMYRSPSPPRNTTLFLDLPETMDRKQQGRGIRAPSPVKSCQKISGDSDNKLVHGDVLSGIEILADVACNNSMVDDGDQEEGSQVKDLKQCGGESTTAMEMSIQNPVPTNEIQKENLSFEDSVRITVPADEIKQETSFIEDSVMNLHETPTVKDAREVEGTISSQDMVFPWDLNVDLHTEEQPADSVPSDMLANTEQSNLLNGSEVEHKPPSPEMPGKTECIGKSVGKIRVLSDKMENNCKSQILESFSNGFLEVVDTKVKSASDQVGERNHEECVPGPSNFAQESSACDGDPKASSEIVDIRLSCDQSLCQDLPKENVASLQENFLVMENKSDNTCNVLSSPVQKLEESPCTMVYVNGVCSASASDSIEDSCQPAVFASFDVEPRSQPGDSGKLDLTDNRENNVTVAAKVDGQFVAVDNKEGNDTSMADPAETTSPTVAASDEVMQKLSVDSVVSGREIRTVHDNLPSRSLVKVAACDASDDSYESDVYQADKVHAIGIGSTLELQGGYDFEDGELRESDAYYYWDKDGEDGEVERLDYGSESDEARLCGTDIEEEVKVERGSSPQSASLRDESVRMSNMTTNRDYQAGVVGSRALQSESMSNAEGPRTTLNNRSIRSSSYGFRELCSRDEEDGNSKRFLGRSRIASDPSVKSPGRRPYVNHNMDSERQCSSTYHGTYLSGPMRRKNIAEDRRQMNYFDGRGSEAGRFSGHTGSQIRRQFMHSTSHGIYEHNRRRSSTNRDDAYLPGGMLPLRDNSPPIRGRYSRYPHVAYRGIREGGFHRAMLEEGPGHSSRMAHRLSRRERSMSPIERRRSQYPIAYKRPLSGSRSRSPIAYIPRERQARPNSRSPVFRSDARMDRGRMQIHKHYTTQYYEEEFIIPPRNHVSPRQGSRWFEEQHGDFENFRRRRSPVRIFRQSQRFESGRPIRRMNSSDEFRPVMQSRKFSDMGGGARRDEFEDMDDDGRPKHRYEMVRQVRRHETEGGVQRFRNNAEESS